MPVDVSVITIGHDVRDEILAAVESVAEHHGELDVETFVVDNASTDGTAEAVAERFPDVEVVRLAENERGAARNHALRRARGRYVMFIDSDARLTPGALEELVSFLEAHPDVGLVGPRLEYPDGGLQYSARRFPPLLLPFLRRPPLGRWFEDGSVVRRHLMMDDPLDRPREVEYVISACVLFPASVQRGNAEIDPRILFPMEDIDFCLQLRRAGYRIAYHPRAVAIHSYRRTTAQQPVSSDALKHLLGFLRLHWKWRGLRGRLKAEGRHIDRRQGALAPRG